MELETLLKSRYSVRSFSDKPVSDEDISAIVEAGRVAPSAKNNQPVRIFCVRTPEGLQKLEACSPCIFGAKTVFVICGDENLAWRSEGEDRNSLDTDCAIAVTQMMLMCTARGLGSCYVFRFDERLTKEALCLPTNLRVHAFLPVGYALMKPSPRHEQRIDMKDFVKNI